MIIIYTLLVHYTYIYVFLFNIVVEIYAIKAIRLRLLNQQDRLQIMRQSGAGLSGQQASLDIPKQVYKLTIY